MAFHKGHVWGHFCFGLYTNDFEKPLSKFHPNMCATDTSIFSSSENPLQLLEGLKKELGGGVMHWQRQNKLSLTVAKCEYMFIGNDKQLSKIFEIGNIEIDIDEIKRVNKTKYLGLAIDENLSWNQQYKVVRLDQKAQRNTATITNFSCIPSINGKPPEI